MEYRMKPAINYSSWKKSRLQEYVNKYSLPITSTNTRGPTRKDYLHAVRASESKYKNLNSKSKADLLALIEERNIPKWVILPSGKRGQRTKRDLIKLIELYRYKSKQSFQRVEFGDVVPRRFANALENLEMRIINRKLDPKTFFDQARLKINKEAMRLLERYNQIKLQLGIKVTFMKQPSLHVEEDNEVTATFLSNQVTVLRKDQLQRTISGMIANLLNKIEKFQAEKSGWTISNLSTLYINSSRYSPIRGSSYIKLPEYLVAKKAIINVKNKDQACLRWSLRAALGLFSEKVKDNLTKNPDYRIKYDRTTIYAKEDGLDFKDIDEPTPVHQVEKVERQNNISINVFGYNQKDGVFPLHISNRHEDKINLLLFSKDENNHYCWIKSLDRLLYDMTKHHERKYFCVRCLQHFSREDLLQTHEEYCAGTDTQPTKAVMPDKNSTIKFKNVHKRLKLPFVIYADFESIIAPTGDTTKTHRHIACGWSYVVVGPHPNFNKPHVYRGQDAAYTLIQALQSELRTINNVFANPKPLSMTREQQIQFERTTTCWICENPIYPNPNYNCQCESPRKPKTKDELKKYSFTNEKGYKEFVCMSCNKKINKFRKVRDHCHVTGQFRGAAHSYCNLKLQIKKDCTPVPVLFHNLKNYDAHLLMQAVAAFCNELECIPKSIEKYISFSLGQLRFLDSFQFLSSSLEKLVETCPKDQFHLLCQFTNNHELLLRKGVYPYEYVDDFVRFNDTILPPKRLFFSTLTQKHISLDDYFHAANVWEKFNCNNLGDYHDLYVQTDTLLLADVFERFRSTCISHYGLDPCQYYTSPGLSWDALLKHSDITLELLTDYDMHLFIERGIRGGVATTGSKRYARANNKYLTHHDPNQLTTYLHYLDANNLYGWAMSQPLPFSNFKWINPEQFTPDIIPLLLDDFHYGYILEVDLEYPRELHDKHNSFPLAPENLKIPKEWLSANQQKLLEDTTPQSKLCTTLLDKHKYVVHYRALKQYLELGLKLTKVHRVLQFKQTAWMASYIAKNTELRKLAKTDFEKDFFKLMNNSVFGKTMENIRYRINATLVGTDDETKLRSLIAKPQFRRTTIFPTCDLAMIEMYNVKHTFNKPIYCGLTVLDVSKTLMYDFFYNHVQQKYPDVSLIYTDTDSLLLEIATDDLYKDMTSDRDMYDFSNYPVSHELYSVKNKKVIGKFKDETGGKPIDEVVCLRPKMYSIQIADDVIKKAKGVTKPVTRRLTHQQYLQTMFEGKQYDYPQTTLQSKNHEIYTVKQLKATLSPLDTKRYVLPNNIDTLAFGHYRLGGNSVSLGTT